MIPPATRFTLFPYTTLFRSTASSSASCSASSSASSSASIITLNLGVGCAPSCWPIFGFRNLLGAPRGLRGQFSVQSDNKFSCRGGGGGSPPRAWRGGGGARRWGGAKKFCEL